MLRLLASRILPHNHSYAAATAATAAAPAITSRRLIISSSVVAMGHGSHSSDNRPEVLEQEKQRNLRGETPEIVPGQPGWNPALASDSEAAVRAEKAPSMDLEELQAHSVKVIQHLHHDGEAPEPSAEVHNPSADSPAIHDNMRVSKEKLKEGVQNDPL